MKERFAWRPDGYQALLAAAVVGYVALFSALAFAQHAGMRTHRSDLGQIHQAVWNSSRGRFVEMTDFGFLATRMTDHFEPILALISPVLWLWQDARALLLLQAAAAGAGAFFVYALAAARLDRTLSAEEHARPWLAEPHIRQTRPLALALALAYLLAPQLQSSLLTEFHAAPLAAPLILWAFWAVERRRWGQLAAAALLTAAVKEEMALLAAGLGVWAAWRAWWDGRRAPGAMRRTQDDMLRDTTGAGVAVGLLVALLGVVWFAVATFVIVPAHAAPVYGVAESGYFARYGGLGDSPADIVRSILTRPALVLGIAAEPARVRYLLGLLAPFAFLPLLGVELLLLSLPVLLANLLSAYPAQYYGDFHYSAPLVPYFAAAAAYGLGRLWRWVVAATERRSASFQQMPAAGAPVMAAATLWHNAATALRPLAALLLAGALLLAAGWAYAAQGRGPLGGRYDPTPITAHHRLLERFTAQIPPGAALTATAAVHPHVSQRRFVYQFPLGLEPGAAHPAEWALIDVTTNTDMAPGDVKARVDSMLAGGWGVVDGADGFLLMRRGAPDKVIPLAFYDFARQSSPAVGDAPLAFVDAHADDWPRWRQTKVVARWRVGPGFNPVEHLPALEVRTPGGETLHTLADAAPPALVWYPPAQWQPGDLITATSLPLHLPAAFGLVGGPTGEEAGPALAGSYVRAVDGRLEPLAAGVFPPAAPGAPGPVEAVVELGQGRTLGLRAWLLSGALYPDRPADLALEWRSPDGWPAELAAFVHLRREGTNAAQADGPPRYFVSPPRQAVGTRGDAPAGEMVSDWRQLAPPTPLPAGGWSLVVGVYNPQTGERLPLLDAAGQLAGEELAAGEMVSAAPPTPDQACALLPATCASQPR